MQRANLQRLENARNANEREHYACCKMTILQYGNVNITIANGLDQSIMMIMARRLMAGHLTLTQTVTVQICPGQEENNAVL